MAVVLVLGGNGFVGRQVCREALKQGHTVYSMSRSGAPQQAIAGVNWLRGDATDPQSYPTTIKPDIIVHSIGTLFESGSLTYKRSSYDTAMAMLQYADKVKGVSVRYVSADDFKGLAQWILPKYFEWKRAAERAIEKQMPEGKRLIVRPGLVMGWERWPTMFLGVLNNLLSLVSGGVIPRAVTTDQLARDLIK